MGNIQRAKLLIKTLETGDVEIAKSFLKENFIQHNLTIPTGRDAFLEKFAGSTTNVVRAFEDGDKVVLHLTIKLNNGEERVAFEIFRFEDGLVAEYWDNISALTPPNPSGHTQIDGVLKFDATVDTETTRVVVSDFIKDVLREEDLSKFTSYFDGNNYIQHNSNIADGVSGLGQALESLAKAGIKMEYFKTHMVLASGNFALGVSEGSFAGAKTTFYDLFRVENKKIAEHWDVMETLPEESIWAHTNGKF